MVVDFTSLKETYASKIIECLNKCIGSKIMIFDRGLTSLNMIANYSLFEKNQIKKTYFLDVECIPQLDFIDHVIFLSSSNTNNVKIISKFIKLIRSKYKCNFSLFVIPCLDMIFMQKLVNESIDDAFLNLESIPIYCYPIDRDLISLENNDSYLNYLLNNDVSVINDIVNSVVTIESLFGQSAIIKGKGEVSKRVAEILLSQKESKNNENLINESKIHRLILIDRSVDLMTPLLTELTYEGLIRTYFDVSASKISLPKVNENNDQEFRSIYLNSSSEYFVSLRYLLFSDCIKSINDSAAKFSREYEAFKKSNSVDDLKRAVTNYPVMKQRKNDIEINTDISEIIAYNIHNDLFEQILSVERDIYIDNSFDRLKQLINKLVGTLHDFNDVIRLLSIYSLMVNGLNHPTYEYYCYAIIQAYGIMSLKLILNLEKMGLIRFINDPNSRMTKPYIDLIKSFKLIDRKPAIRFYECYTPLSCKLISYFIHDTLPNVALRNLTENNGYLGQSDNFSRVRESQSNFSLRPQQEFSKSQTILVFFVGGCTSSEIGYLRSLSQAEGTSFDILIVTTSIITSKSIIDFANRN